MKVLMSWQIGFFYLSLMALLLTSSKPLWWLPLLSLVIFVLSFPVRQIKTVPNWQDWHPVFMTLVFSPLAAKLYRWVRYKKITGGDFLMLLPLSRESGLLLLDLSKNDLETFLHFVWLKALVAYGWNRSKSQLLKLLEIVRQCSDRVDLSYLVGFFSQNEANWQSVGCFGVSRSDSLMKVQKQILPTFGRTLWKARGRNVNWVFTTDGVATYLSEVVEFISRNGSPEGLIANLSRQDDLTVGWFATKFEALAGRFARKQKGADFL